MRRTPVWTSDPAYAAAIAQLEGRVQRVGTPRGAVCVVDPSRHGLGEVRSLLLAGPAAVVLSHPDRADAALLDVLADANVPVVVDRPLLRPDVIAHASGMALQHVVIDVVGSPADLQRVLTDGVGWVRVALGDPLRVVTTAITHAARVGALEGPGGTTATIGATVLSAPLPPALDMQGLGERRLEVEIDAVTGIRLRIHDSEGFTERVRQYEAHERAALRRALEASSGADLAELAHDRAVADSILG